MVDTNVLVYAYDRAEPQKQHQAILLLDHLVQQDRGALTTQILAEFFVTVTRKLAAPLRPADAYTRIEHFLLAWTVYETSGLVILEAARGVRDHHLSYWDAQIWATARLYQVPVVLSEDFASGSTLEIVQATACWRRSPFCVLRSALDALGMFQNRFFQLDRLVAPASSRWVFLTGWKPVLPSLRTVKLV